MKRFSKQVKNSPLPADFMENLPAYFDGHGVLIHNARNQIRVFDVDGRKINVKKYCIPPIVNRILYSLGWRTPKAQATYQNAQKILENGFLTPRPFGYLLEKQGGLLKFSYFVSEQLENVRPMGYQKHEDSLIKALAAYTAVMHEKGLLHIDYTPNNILFAEKNGQYTFYLVDINRFRFYKDPVPMSAVLTNLMKPFHGEEQIETFVKAYAVCRGWDENLYKKVLCRRRLRNKYDDFKDNLKKIPLSGLFINKPLGK